MADSDTGNAADSTLAPKKRDESTDAPVTTLATVDASTTLAEMKDMSGATDKKASQQQLDALDGLRQAKALAKDPASAQPAPAPFASGPGGMVA